MAAAAELVILAWPSYRNSYMTKLKPKACGYCNRPFTPRRKTQLFCCREHRLKRRQERRNHQRYCARKERERTLEGKFVCIGCGGEIMYASRTSRRYCSRKCKQQSYRDRVSQRTQAQIEAISDKAMRQAAERLKRAAYTARALKMIRA